MLVFGLGARERQSGGGVQRIEVENPAELPKRQI